MILYKNKNKNKEKQRAYKEQQIKFYKAEAQNARQANVSPGRLNIPEQWLDS